MKILIMAILFFVFGFLSNVPPEKEECHETSVSDIDMYLDVFLDRHVERRFKNFDKIYFGDLNTSSKSIKVDNCMFVSLRKNPAFITTLEGSGLVSIENCLIEFNNAACEIKLDLE